MDKQTSLAILNKVREKRSSVGDDFANAINEANAQRLRDIATSNIQRIALASLGIGAAARGGVGLYNQIRRAVSPPKVTTSPAAMALPYPVEGEEENVAEKAASAALIGSLLGAMEDRGTPHQGTGIGRGMIRGALTDLGATAGAGLGAGLGTVIAGGRDSHRAAVPIGGVLGAGLGGVGGYLGSGALLGEHPREKEEEERNKRRLLGPVHKKANFLLGNYADTVKGVPWYAPASTLAAIGGGTLGWKGVDAILADRRKKERQDDLTAARQEFHDALLGQYDKPVKSAPKQASDAATESIAASLDSLFTAWQEKTAGARWRSPEGVQAIMRSDLVKQASMSDLAGQLAGGYGIYAGLAGLGTGALVYNSAKKRQRRAVLEKAMKRRERRRFNTSPSEIVAIPEPMTHQPDVDISVPKLGVDYFIGRCR